MLAIGMEQGHGGEEKARGIELLLTLVLALAL